MKLTRFVVLSSLLLAASGCSDDTPDGTWVSTLGGSDAWLAVSVQDGQAVAFVCGGETTLTTHSRWMYGGEARDEDSLDFEADGWRLFIDLEEQSASGHLISSTGDTLAFGAESVPSGGVEGLFNAVIDGCRAGFIAVNRGNTTVTKGAFCDERGFVSEVTPVTPISLTADGIAVTTSSNNEQHDFLVEPVDATLLAGP